jgi:hypothetical protein
MPSGCRCASWHLKDCFNLQVIHLIVFGNFFSQNITLAVTMAFPLFASSLKGLTPVTELSTPKLTEQKPKRNFKKLKNFYSKQFYN